MTEVPDQTRFDHVSNLIERMKAGEQQARERLMALAAERFLFLAGAVKQEAQSDGAWEQPAEWMQQGRQRLWNALAVVDPRDPRHFFRLAASYIRRELIDLTKRLQELRADDVADDATRSDGEKSVDELVQELPEPMLEILDLRHYQGLSTAETAAILQVNTSAVQRRLRAAKLLLAERLGAPPLSPKLPDPPRPDAGENRN